MTDREMQVVFAMAPGRADKDGIPVLTFLMPPKSWTYMAGGMGHEFDLTNVGIPLRVLIGRCASHADGMDMIYRANADCKDARDVDMRLNKKPTQ
jgi:hypothetical protein